MVKSGHDIQERKQNESLFGCWFKLMLNLITGFDLFIVLKKKQKHSLRM